MACPLEGLHYSYIVWATLLGQSNKVPNRDNLGEGVIRVPSLRTLAHHCGEAVWRTQSMVGIVTEACFIWWPTGKAG